MTNTTKPNHVRINLAENPALPGPVEGMPQVSIDGVEVRHVRAVNITASADGKRTSVMITFYADVSGDVSVGLGGPLHLTNADRTKDKSEKVADVPE